MQWLLLRENLLCHVVRRQNSTFSPHLRQELVAYAEGGPASAFSRVDEIECGKKRIKVTVGASKWPN